MNDTLTQRVMQAFYEADKAGCTLEQCWQAAIEASGAKHLQGLVEALQKVHRIFMIPSSEYIIAVPEARVVIDNALAALPPELRGEV